jgi:hypothetical protein
MMLPLLETFLEFPVVEQLSMPLSHFLDVFNILIPLRVTLFLETARNLSEPNLGNRVGVPFQ